MPDVILRIINTMHIKWIRIQLIDVFQELIVNHQPAAVLLVRSSQDQ